MIVQHKKYEKVYKITSNTNLEEMVQCNIDEKGDYTMQESQERSGKT